MSTAKDQVFLAMAQQLGQLSTCDRAAVGAIITREGRAVSWGYNGSPPGMEHCEENNHGWTQDLLAGKKLVLGDRILDVGEEGLYVPGDQADPNIVSTILRRAVEKYGCRNSTHAEANAVAFAARQGISTEGGTLYVSVAPCVNCARLLIAAGIARVAWSFNYRDTTGPKLLKRAWVELVPPAELTEEHFA